MSASDRAGAGVPGGHRRHGRAVGPRYDDAVIGRAFRVSLVALILFAVLGAGIALAMRRPPPPPERMTPLAGPVAPERPTVDIPWTPFTDVTREAGIEFVHANGARGEKLLPETMGGGVAFLDYDLDGWPDLLTVNGHLEDEIHKVQQSQTDAQPAQLFWNAGGQSLPRFQVVPTRGYLSQSELTVTCGLGRHRTIDRLEVWWPGGQMQEVAPPEVNRLVAIEEALPADRELAAASGNLSQPPGMGELRPELHSELHRNARFSTKLTTKLPTKFRKARSLGEADRLSSAGGGPPNNVQGLAIRSKRQGAREHTLTARFVVSSPVSQASRSEDERNRGLQRKANAR